MEDTVEIFYFFRGGNSYIVYVGIVIAACVFESVQQRLDINEPQLPCTQLLLTVLSLDISLPHWTNWCLDVSQFSRLFPTLPFMPALWQSLSTFPWSSKSKAFWRSKDQTSIDAPWSSAFFTILSCASKRFVWQPLFGLKHF